MRSKLVKKAVAVAVAAVAAVAGVGALTGGAPYVEPPKSDGDYVLALWKGDESQRLPMFPQTLIASIKTDDASLDQLDDEAIECGIYQLDLYNNSAKTRDLLAGTVMHGPGRPHADYASVDEHSRVFTVKECPEQLVETGDPAFPTFVDDCGVTGDAIVLPEVEHVEYTVTDARVHGVGQVAVEAAAADGYVLPEGVEVRWTFSFTDQPCETVPAVEEPVVEEPVVEEPVVEEPADSAEPAEPVVEAAAEPETLPDTGFDVAGVGVIGGVVMLTGLALVFARRRMGWGA
ncbi:LPXTG cell wall anchor domain-containing protein [Agrococcus casei]|uniref:LPXTG cell wall anchor domain-containing protein n=1 Tax=Agrococcus casei LMG 22410 TaxID=1255656 RepID=A0A1R4GGW2_9MICO|nr:LPXTG cell wall anchor domain-containing protein [Agrococcus casei]SJM67344.1 hypothetical protein CZ674_11875 [Agrococcus casei LMG 22410]